MAVGLSDGTSYPDSDTWLATVDTRTGKQRSDQSEINSNTMSGDFQSRFSASDQSTMPLGASTELAGALKQSGGSQTPGNGEKARFTTSSPLVNITDSDIDNAISVGFSAGPGIMAGVKSITNLTGAAKNKALSDLGHAQILEAAGEHPDAITQKTGFHRGAEGRWKYEINDIKSAFDPKWHENAPAEEWSITRYSNPNAPLFVEDTKIAKLSEVIDHPELFQAYPLLKDVKVIRDPSYAATGAEYNAGSGPGKLVGAQIRMGTEAAENQGTLMHEIQHAVQGFEGFAKGGASRSDASYLKFTPDMKALEPEMKALVAKIDDPKAVWTAKEIERRNYITELAKKYREYTEAAHVQAHEYYLRLAGEVEARNVDTRLLLTEAERRRIHPTWTEDTPRSKQIVREEPTSTTAYGIVDKGKYVKP